ncbi:hypothetical protein V8C86DRAFT_2675283 [Haematococcus lacustris]
MMAAWLWGCMAVWRSGLGGRANRSSTSCVNQHDCCIGYDVASLCLKHQPMNTLGQSRFYVRAQYLRRGNIIIRINWKLISTTTDQIRWGGSLIQVENRVPIVNLWIACSEDDGPAIAWNGAVQYGLVTSRIHSSHR